MLDSLGLEDLGHSEMAPKPWDEPPVGLYSAEQTVTDHLQAALNGVSYLMALKQKDYGPDNIARTPFGNDRAAVLRAVCIRLGDKLARMAHLIETGQVDDPANESAGDTAADIMGYGAILAVVLAGNWPGVDD